ncbi:MAG: MBL fold metallo-hydrolase [Thermodesulfovibrio sp.]|nr:MBL fold metallo-hydrolase [Thermodesulfovibrio sp.]
MKHQMKTRILLLAAAAVLFACSAARVTGGTMLIQSIAVGQLAVNCYIVSDGNSREALIIDPGDEPERIAAFVGEHGLKPKYIVFTHAHYDHICAAGDLHKLYGVPIIMHEAETGTYQSSKEFCVSRGFSREDFPADFQTVREGGRITVASLVLEIIHTPGHTPGSMGLSGGKALFTGDTLFKGTVGRTDLPGGNTQQLMGSLKKLTALPPDTRVLCGHGEETTLGRELKSNPYLNEKFKLKLYQ